MFRRVLAVTPRSQQTIPFGELLWVPTSLQLWNNSKCDLHTKSQFRDYIDSAFSEEQTANILKYFNEGTEDQLLSVRHLTRNKIHNIIQHRALTDGYNTLSSVLNVPGIGFLGLKKVCEVLKDYDFQENSKLFESSVERLHAQSHLPLTSEQCMDIQRLVALNIQQDKLHWAVVSRELVLCDWGMTVIFDRPFQKYDHVEFMKKLNAAVDLLPSGDIYTMEEKMYKCPNLRLVPYIMGIRITESMLAAIINRDYHKTGQHKLYSVKPNIVNKCFGLSVGGERVSGQHIVYDLIESSREENARGTSLYIPPHLSLQFKSGNNEEKELLSSCLLQALAFYKLIIFPRYYSET